MTLTCLENIMEQEVVTSRNPNSEAAVEELCKKLKRDASSYQAVIFVAAISYDFAILSSRLKEKFPHAEVIGTSTAGEISPQGFQNDSIVLTTMYDSSTRVKGVFIDHGSTYPIAYKNDIESALRTCGISTGDRNSHRDAFAITFISAVYNAEETILSNFYAIINNDQFKLAGGTAGFTGNTPKSFVCYNGKVTQDGAVMLFVKTRCKFDIRQEVIFNPTGKKVFVTKSDPIKREISMLDGKPAASVYAQTLGVSEATAAKQTFENPFGRYVNGSLHIAALAGLSADRKITLFARIPPNSTLELMHIGDPQKKADETCAGILKEIPRPKFTLLMTCITRTIAFGNMRIADNIIRKYNSTFPTFCGFSCYGEQNGHAHCNQTLVSLVMGE